jgi:hypothetical protein
METFDLGSAILIEVEFKTNNPFGSEDYYNPATSTITVYDAYDNVKVDAAALIQSDTGKYYYIIQSTIDWSDGVYKVKVDSGNGSYDDVTIKREFFRLI